MKKLRDKFLSLSKETRLGIYFALGALLLIALDVISKWAVQHNLSEGDSLAIIPNFFYITLSYNTGAAFSLGSSWGVWGRILGIAISLVMSGAIVWYWAVNNKKVHNFERVCLMLLVSGAIGNLIDRAFYWKGTVGFDGVIDFLQFYLGGGPSKAISVVNPFATFNVADACLVVGVILMIIALALDAYKASKSDPKTKDPRLEASEAKEAKKEVDEGTKEDPKPSNEEKE
jgi:signal peptidase II